MSVSVQTEYLSKELAQQLIYTFDEEVEPMTVLLQHLFQDLYQQQVFETVPELFNRYYLEKPLAISTSQNMKTPLVILALTPLTVQLTDGQKKTIIPPRSSIGPSAPSLTTSHGDSSLARLGYLLSLTFSYPMAPSGITQSQRGK